MTVDVTDPSSPKIVGICDLAGYATDIAVAANYAYVTVGSTLSIVNISNPAAPALTDNYDTDGNAESVVIAGNYAYVANGWNGIEIVNVNNPAAPAFAGDYGTGDYVHELAVAGNYVYAADGWNGLVILDISIPAAPTFAGGYGGISPYVFAVEGDYAYVAGLESNLEIVDISDPASTILVDSYVTDGSIVAVSGNYSYEKSGDQIKIVDISNPDVPILAGTYDTDGTVSLVAGNYAYVPNGNYLDILDVSNLSSLTLAGTYDTDGSVSAASGNYAYLTNGSCLEILDISDPSSPTLAVTYDTDGLVSAVENNYIFVVDNGLTILSVESSRATSQENTVSYTASYDNRLRESSAGTVLSTTTYLDIGRSTSRCRDVMLFDLNGYKTTDTISKATLSLYWYYPADATRISDTVVEVYRPVEWDPKYVTWRSRASGTLWSTAGGNWFDKNGVSQGSTPYASITFPAGKVPDNKYYEFEVTQLVQEYVSGEYKNTGFFLKAKTESGNYIAFYSSEWSNAAQRPKLTITR